MTSWPNQPRPPRDKTLAEKIEDYIEQTMEEIVSTEPESPRRPLYKCDVCDFVTENPKGFFRNKVLLGADVQLCPLCRDGWYDEGLTDPELIKQRTYRISEQQGRTYRTSEESII